MCRVLDDERHKAFMGTLEMYLIVYTQTCNLPILVRPLLQEMIQAQETPLLYLYLSSSAALLTTSCASLVDVMLVSLHEPGTTPSDVWELCNTTVPFLISASSVMEIRAHLH